MWALTIAGPAAIATCCCDREFLTLCGGLDVGGEGIGDGPASTMKLIASNVQTLVIPGCGHWGAEQAPNDLLAGLAEFLDS